MNDDVTPFTKERQLDRPARKRYRRKVASRKQWEALSAEKHGPCRACGDPTPVVLHLHHLVFRSDDGDDIADNLAPLCGDCHTDVHNRNPQTVRLLLSNLTDAEYAYVADRGGEGYFERVYGLEFTP